MKAVLVALRQFQLLVETAQRVDHWGAILALQAFTGIHVGIDNVYERLPDFFEKGLDGTPFPSIKDNYLRKLDLHHALTLGSSHGCCF